MKRAVRWALVSVGLAGVITAMTLAPGGATPPVGLTNTPLARGTNTSDGTIPLQGRNGRRHGADHRRSRAALRVGTRIRGARSSSSSTARSRCTSRSAASVETTTYTAGQAFVERPGEVDQVINTGADPVRPVRHLPARASGRVRREPTSRTRARVQVSDDLTERDVRACGVAVAERLLEGGDSPALQRPGDVPVRDRPSVQSSARFR